MKSPYRENGVEYQFNKAAFKTLVESRSGRKKDGKTTRKALFDEWAKALQYDSTSIKNWYSTSKQTSPSSLKLIKELATVTGMDYHYFLLEVGKKKGYTDMDTIELRETLGHIENYLKQISDDETTTDTSNIRSAIESVFEVMVGCIYAIRSTKTQCNYELRDEQFIASVKRETESIHRHIDCKALSLTEEYRYTLHRMACDLEAFSCGYEALGELGERLMDAVFYCDDFNRDEQVMSYPSTYLEDEILLAERLGYNEDDIQYVDDNTQYEDAELLTLGFQEHNHALEMNGGIVGTDLMIRALKEAFEKSFPDYFSCNNG